MCSFEYQNRIGALKGRGESNRADNAPAGAASGPHAGALSQQFIAGFRLAVARLAHNQLFAGATRYSRARMSRQSS